MLTFRKSLGFILCLLASFIQGYSQAGEPAVVTPIQVEVKLYPAWRSILSEESFPDYITSDTLWQLAMRQKVEQWVQQKFAVKQVLFTDSMPVHFRYSKGTLLKQAQSEVRPGQLLINIHQTIGLTTTGVDEAGIMAKNFNYTCRVQVKEDGNKIIFEGNAVIPFRTRVKPEAGMYSIAELTSSDVKKLSEEALQAAFTPKLKKLAQRTYYRPAFSNTKYDTFIAGATLYSLQEYLPDTPEQEALPNSRKYIFTSSRQTTDSATLQLKRSYTGNVPEDTYTCRAMFTNGLNQTTYQMWATLQQKSKTDNNIPDEKPEVSVRCFADRLLLGDFTLTDRKFEGMTGYTVFSIYQISPRNTLELHVNNQVKAIIQKGGISSTGLGKKQQYYLYIPKEATRDDTSELLTIFMIYKVAYELGQDFL